MDRPLRNWERIQFLLTTAHPLVTSRALPAPAVDGAIGDRRLPGRAAARACMQVRAVWADSSPRPLTWRARLKGRQAGTQGRMIRISPTLGVSGTCLRACIDKAQHSQDS